MPRYVIEREIPGAGDLSDRDLVAISKKSKKVLQEMGPDIQWDHSYVTGGKIFCVYIAPNEELIREHGKRGEFPVTNVYPVVNIIDPTTAEKSG
ncbi:MAG TPA: DUF4242 domain-containing protein [bacterium]|nr:DUF4242 domain-containing protein [bacterium]